MVFVVLPHHSYYRYFYPLTTVVMWLGTTKNRTFNAEKPPFGAVFLKKGGPSDRIRTCGILLPKQARYQLRYTRLLSYFIRLGVFSQTTRATNCANPGFGYSVLLQMWSNMWSGSFFDHLGLRGNCLYFRRIKGLRARCFPA